MKIKNSDIIDFLKQILRVEHKHLASFLNISDEQIQRHQNNILNTELNDRFQKRLYNLYLAVKYLCDQNISSMDIISCLKMVCYPDVMGNKDSFISANCQDKYETAQLLKIVAESYIKYQEHLDEKQNFISNIKKILTFYEKKYIYIIYEKNKLANILKLVLLW